MLEDKILVTGGAGFIGSHFVRYSLQHKLGSVINLDCLTYAGHLENLSSALKDPRHTFVKGDIQDATLLKQVFELHRPVAVVHFAAETHVDRSISTPEQFVKTNVGGTLQVLQSTHSYWSGLGVADQSRFRFVHISTDEVFGSLDHDEPPFTENDPYAPNSPYAASKAASDHLVRAYNRTYGLPTLIVNSSNNYGPRQFPEKLVPLMILNALSDKPLPIYGDGLQVRDWLYVEDQCEAIRILLEKGTPGHSYNVGGGNQRTNIELVKTVTAVLDRCVPRHGKDPYNSLLRFVTDRPGHDRRYAIDSSKIMNLGWSPTRDFESGIRETVEWYVDNQEWVRMVWNQTR